MTAPTIDLNKTLGEHFAHLIQPGATITEEEAQEIGVTLLRSAGIPLKIWQKGDLDEAAHEQAAPGKADELADHIWENREFTLRQLEDNNDAEWDIISEVAQQTAKTLGLAKKYPKTTAPHRRASEIRPAPFERNPHEHPGSPCPRSRPRR